MSHTEATAGDGATAPQKNRLGLGLGLAGLASLVVGLIIGFSGDTDCGSPFAPDSSGAALYDAMVGGNTAAGCAEDLAGPTAAAWAFTLVGVLLIVLGMILANVLNRPQGATQTVSEPPIPSPAERLTALDQLRAEGVITEDEYQTKRSEVLEGL